MTTRRTAGMIMFALPIAAAFGYALYALYLLSGWHGIGIAVALFVALGLWSEAASRLMRIRDDGRKVSK